MSDITRATRVLLAAIDGVPEGTVVDADNLRDVFDAAQLTVAERGGAFQSAHHRGYIVRQGFHPSGHPSRKSGSTHTWARTAKAVPAHVCEVA